MKLEDIAPYLSATGFGLISIDVDDVGADDVAGQFLMYGGDAIFAIQHNLDLPPLPEIAANAVAGKLSTTARLVLMMAGINLMILQGQVAGKNPKLALVLRYIAQVIAALMAGRAIPAAPTGLTA